MGEWKVRPKGDGQRWLVVSPDGHVEEFVTCGLAIEFGRQRAQEAHDIGWSAIATGESSRTTSDSTNSTDCCPCVALSWLSSSLLACFLFVSAIYSVVINW